MRRILAIAIVVGLVGCNDDDGSCGGSVEAYCSGGTKCPLTWTAAHDPNAWANTAPTCNQDTSAVQLFTCPDVLVAHVKHVDTGETYYFDSMSGELYRVDRDVLIQTQTTCLVGNGPAETCNDPNPVVLCTQP